MAEHIGSQFFLRLPPSPRVYLMRDRNNRVLYVGHSRNLKQHLAADLVAHPDQSDRKVIRLIGKIHRLDFATYRTVEEAILLENHLIRLHRPRFNSLHSHPESNPFITLSSHHSGVKLDFSTVLIVLLQIQNKRSSAPSEARPLATDSQAFASAGSTTIPPLIDTFCPCTSTGSHLHDPIPSPFTANPHRHNGRLKRKLWDFPRVSPQPFSTSSAANRMRSSCASVILGFGRSYSMITKPWHDFITSAPHGIEPSSSTTEFASGRRSLKINSTI